MVKKQRIKLNRIFAFLLIVALLIIIAIFYPNSSNDSEKKIYDKEKATLLRVVDGDTIHALVNGKDETIRLLGINAPEKIMPLSEKSADFLRRFENKTVYLQKDKEDTDIYNRKLRYVFYENRSLNLELVESGLVNIYYTSGLAYENQFISAEKQARTLGVGFWQKSQEKCALAKCIQLKQLDDKNEFYILKNNCSHICDLNGWFVKDTGRNVFRLGSFNAFEEKRYDSTNIKSTEIWQEHDKLFLFDKSGYIVLFYEY